MSSCAQFFSRMWTCSSTIRMVLDEEECIEVLRRRYPFFKNTYGLTQLRKLVDVAVEVNALQFVRKNFELCDLHGRSLKGVTSNDSFHFYFTYIQLDHIDLI